MAAPIQSPCSSLRRSSPWPLSASAASPTPSSTIGQGNDATAYDPVLKRAFASNGEGSLTVIDGSAPYAVLQTVPTMQRARTMALDPVSHQVFLVAAEAAAGTPPAGTRPTLKPGT